MLVIDWRKKQTEKAKIKVSIEKELDKGLPELYDKPMFNEKCGLIYDYVWENM